LQVAAAQKRVNLAAGTGMFGEGFRDRHHEMEKPVTGHRSGGVDRIEPRNGN
jgi:hypothetical protein